MIQVLLYDIKYPDNLETRMLWFFSKAIFIKYGIIGVVKDLH